MTIDFILRRMGESYSEKKKGFKQVNKPGVRLKATVQGGKKSYLARKKINKYVKNQVGHREPHEILL